MERKVIAFLRSLWAYLFGAVLMLAVNSVMLAPLAATLSGTGGPLWYLLIVAIDAAVLIVMLRGQSEAVWWFAVVLFTLHCFAFAAHVDWSEPGWVIFQQATPALLLAGMFAYLLTVFAEGFYGVAYRLDREESKPDYYLQLQQARGRIEELETSQDVAYEVQQQYEAELQAAKEEASKQSHLAERYRLQAEEFQAGLTEAAQKQAELEEQLADSRHNTPAEIVTDWQRVHNTHYRVSVNGDVQLQYRRGKNGEITTVQFDQ